MKLAVAIWEGRVAPVFDVARRVLVLTMKDGKTVSTVEKELGGDLSPEKVDELMNMGVDTLICGAVSKSMLRFLHTSGLRTIPFIAGDVDRVITAHTRDRLSDPEFAMPGNRDPSWMIAPGLETAQRSQPPRSPESAGPLVTDCRARKSQRS